MGKQTAQAKKVYCYHDLNENTFTKTLRKVRKNLTQTDISYCVRFYLRI